MSGRIPALFLAAGLCACAPQNAAAETVVRFVCYNLENYLSPQDPADDTTPAQPRKSEESIQAVVEILADLQPDVLGVLEIGGEDQVGDLRSRLARAGVDLPHSEWTGGSDTVRHLALLSRHPITARDSERTIAFDLDDARHAMQRGILDVTIEPVDGFPLRFVGVHLKSKRRVPEFDQALFRAKEMLALRAHLDAIFTSDAEVRLIVFGDLNETRNEPTFRNLVGPRGAPGALSPLDLTDHLDQRWTHYWEAADIYSRIDFILVSRRAQPLVDTSRSGIAFPANWNLASDHRPMYATFLIPKEPTP